MWQESRHTSIQMSFLQPTGTDTVMHTCTVCITPPVRHKDVLLQVRVTGEQFLASDMCVKARAAFCHTCQSVNQLL